MKRYFLNILLLPAVLIAAPVTFISQYGITFYFDHAYESGTFANGDYWVVGPVVIDSITPDFNGINNGWQVNPVSSWEQGFDAGANQNGGSSFNRDLVPDLPYTAQPGQSLVKAISKFQGSSSDCYPSCLTTAAVLTVVGEIPPDNGASVLRPPYPGNDKSYYSIEDIRTDLLPSYPAVANMPSLSSITQRFQRVQFHHGQSRMGRIIRPEDNMNNYQPENAVDQNEAILRLMMDDPIGYKMSALINILQAGIDAYHAVLTGQDWPYGGGYEPGHKLLISFAAAMFNRESMIERVNAENFWLEHTAFYRSKQTGTVLWGFTPPAGSWKTQKDSAEYIDAPTTDYGGDGYLVCCLATPMKTATLAVHLMPQLQTMWHGEKWELMSEFIDRWVTFGWWTQPDPYNRFPNKHGTEADGGSMSSNFIRNVWNTYRDEVGGESVRIITQTLPNADVGTPYSTTLQANGGSTPYAWTLVSGTLPQGLSLNEDGIISGTPSESGEFEVTVRVTDAENTVSSGVLTCNVIPDRPLEVSELTVLSPASIQIAFNKEVDSSTAVDAANYTFNQNITILSIQLVSGNSVSIETEEQKPDINHRICISNVAERNGNGSSISDTCLTYQITIEKSFEAETARLSGPVVIENNDQASGGAYITTTSAEEGSAEMNFTIDNEGKYAIFGRVYAPTQGRNSFYYSINESDTIIWDIQEISASWDWKPVSARGKGSFDAPEFDTIIVDLSEGDYTIEFFGRESSTFLDAVKLVRLGDVNPVSVNRRIPAISNKLNIVNDHDLRSRKNRMELYNLNGRLIRGDFFNNGIVIYKMPQKQNQFKRYLLTK